MSYNTPVRLLQQGSVEEVASSGTLLVSSGGSIQVASGGVLQIASGGSVVNSGGASANSGSVTYSGSVSVTGVISAANGITLGGTLGRWAFGTVGLTAGLGTIATGLNRVISANAAGLLGEAPSIGSVHWVLVDLSLSNAGSVILRAGSANGQFGANATVSWQAFGT